MKKTLFNKKSILCLIVLCSILLASLFALIIFNTSNVLWKTYAVDIRLKESLKDEYFIGEEANIPEATLVIDDMEIPATAYVIKPDGSMLRTYKLRVDKAGKYIVRYEGTLDDKTYTDTKYFNVYKPLYEVLGKGSVSYGLEQKFNNDVKGIKLTLTDNSVFRLNRKVNLNTLDNETPFIKLHIVPEHEGFSELERIFIRVVDAYDENTFFAISLRHFNNSDPAKRTGVFGFINEYTTVYNGEIVCIPQHADWTGWSAKISFEGDGSVFDTSLYDQAVSFYYNSSFQRITGKDLSGTETRVLSLNAFDDVWSGFTTGEVYIEIFGENFTSSKANLFIDSIADIDLEGTKLDDNDAPEISIDYGAYDEKSYPKGYVDYTYPLFDATAFDTNDGFIAVKRNVYYNYYSDDRAVVSVKDGRFKPTREGTYTIEYSATDIFGNRAEEIVDITVNRKDLVTDFQHNNPSHVTACAAGERIDLPEVEFSGNVGAIIKELKITKGSKTFDADTLNNKFTAMETGVYSVVYSAVDFIGRTCTFDYELTVSKSDKPVFVDDPLKSVSGKFIVGYRNKLPDIQAVYFTDNNGSYKTATVTVETNDGTIENGYYTPEAAGDVSLTFKATCDGETATKVVERKAYSIKDVNGKIDMKSLFVFESVNVESTYYAPSKCAEYKFTGNGKIEFINTVLSENAYIQLQTDEDYKDIYSLTVHLKNPLNDQKTLTVAIQNKDGGAYVSVNGGALQTVINGDFSGEHSFNIAYKDSKRIIEINGFSYEIGDNFKGLDSDYAILEIEVECSTYGLIVEKVGNQTLKENITADATEPMIAFVGDRGGVYPNNSVYITPKVVVKDMICPCIKTFSMSIITPSGQYVIRDVDAQQYEFELTEFGDYIVIYYVEDYEENGYDARVIVHVLDNIAPTVKVSFTDSKTYMEGAVGKTIPVADYTVTDNVDAVEDISVTVLVFKPDHNYVIVNYTKNATQFTPDKAGKYRVFYYATDLFGNVGLCYYDVEVK